MQPTETVTNEVDSPKPMFGFDQTIEYGGRTIDVAKLAEIDLQRQYGERLGPSDDEVKAKFQQIMSSTTVEELRQTGVGDRIGDKFITPGYLSGIKGTGEEIKLFNQFKKMQQRQTVDPFATAIPFSGPQYEKTVLPQELQDLPDELVEPVLAAIKNRQNVAKLFKPLKGTPEEVNYLGRQILLDSFKTGELIDEAGKAFRNIPGDVARLPTFLAMVTNAMYAGVEAMEFFDSEGGMDTTYGERFKKTFGEGMASWADFIRGYEGTLNKTALLESAGQTFNKWYKAKFIKEHGEDLWDEAHREDVFRIVKPNDDDYDEAIAEQENGIGNAYVVQEFNEDGTAVRRDRGLSLELVSDLMDMAYNELAANEKALVFASSQVPLTLGLTARAVRRGNVMAREVNNARDANPSRYVEMSDWDVWTSISKDKAATGINIARNRFTQFILGTGTLGVFGFKGKGAMDRGTLMNQHLSNLENFDDQIAAYKSSIQKNKAIIKSETSSLDAKRAARDQIKQDEDGLKTTQGSYTAYKLRAGGSRGRLAAFNNPYVRSMVTDDILIATAVAYVPQVLSWDKIGMEQQTAETLTMFTAPLFAPPVARGALFGIANVSKRITSGVTQDVAETLQHASFIPYITPGIIARGDEAELRKIMGEANIAITDRNVEAFKTLSNVYKQMKPEYQLRFTQSIQRYNKVMENAETTMRNLKSQDGTPILSDAEISKNMDTLHLSLAHATGIAPLIAIQARNGRRLAPDDLRKAGKFDELMASLAAEEANYKGLDTLLKTLQQSLVTKAGIDMDSNDMLQNMLVELQNVATNGLEKLNLKKQQADGLVDMYMNELGEIDENTLKRIVSFKMELSEKDIRDPVEQARVTAEVAVKILENGRLQAAALQRFRNTLDGSEVLKQANVLADKIFDITEGVRRSKVSQAYGDVTTYANEKGISVDLSVMAKTLMNKTDEFKDQPFTFFLGQAGSFFNTGNGARAKASFESAAMRGLREEYGDDLPYIFDLAVMNNPKIKNHTDLALYLMDEAAEGQADSINYFKASVEESENIYRAFRDHQATAKNQNVAELDDTFKEAVDEAYAASDSSGELLRLAKLARETHETLIGETSDKGRYAGQVFNGRTRKDVKSADPTEGRHFYRIPADKPIAPFKNIAVLARKAVEETDEAKRGLILQEIMDEKDRIMYWYGAGYMNDGAIKGYGFDLSDGKQRAVADTMQSLLQTLIGKEVADSAQSMLNNALDATTPIGIGTKTGAISKSEAIQRLREGQDYDFDRAARILEVQKALSVVTRNGTEGPLETRNLALPEIQDFSVKLDELLQHDAVTRKTYRETQEALNNNKSAIRQAAQQEVDATANTLKIMGGYDNLINNPKQFFDTVFENATEDSINRHVQRFVAQGMNEKEVRSAMAYMYIRGLEIKSGKKTEMVANEPAQVIADSSVLIDYVNTPRHAKVMRSVLGDEHFKIMKNIAEWADFAIGNGMGFRANPELQGMSVESVFSRVFNLARGMVSPIYVATEVSVRTMMQRNQSLISFALNDRVAARIMSKMLNRPKEITRKDLKLFGLRIQNYVASDIIRNGGEVPTLEQILGEDNILSQDEIVTKDDRRLEELQRKRIEELSPVEEI